MRPWRRPREHRTKRTVADILGTDRSVENILANADELAQHFEDDWENPDD